MGDFCPCLESVTSSSLLFLPLLDSPSVTIQQCSTPVTEGDNTTLYCNATGNPVPNTAWIKAGEVVSYSKRLVIANISRSESGSYKCLAWNGVGNNGTKSCTVDIQCKLRHYFRGFCDWVGCHANSKKFKVLHHS